jgi:hypothetical protein
LIQEGGIVVVKDVLYGIMYMEYGSPESAERGAQRYGGCPRVAFWATKGSDAYIVLRVGEDERFWAEYIGEHPENTFGWEEGRAGLRGGDPPPDTGVEDARGAGGHFAVRLPLCHVPRVRDLHGLPGHHPLQGLKPHRRRISMNPDRNQRLKIGPADPGLSTASTVYWKGPGIRALCAD